MATYRYNSFKFPAAALKGVDADCVKGLRSFLSSRETAINTITTSSFRYCDGPFAGQVVELCGMSTFDIGTLDINVNGWIGRYSNGEWHGTTGKPVTVHESTGEKAKVTKAKTGKGFTLFEQLLCELAEPIEDRKIFTDVMTYHRFIYGRQDDFGDHIYGRDGRPAIYQDDFGDTFVYENEDGRYELCKTIVSRAVYTIGRTTFKVLPTEQGIDNLRARLIKARKWFADKYFIKPEPVIVAPVEPDVDLLGDTISIAASADVEALVAIAAAQCTAIEDTADTETVDLELVTCEAESESAEHGASAGSENPSTVDSGASNVIFADFRPVKPAENPAFTGDDVPADTPSAVSTDTPTTPAMESSDQSWPKEYIMNVARFSKNKVSVTTPSTDGFKTRAARLAGTFGRFSKRDNGYIMSRGQASTFARLYADGWDASIMGSGSSSREAPITPTSVSEPTPINPAAKPKTIIEADDAIHVNAMADEFRGYFESESRDIKKAESVSAWRKEFSGDLVRTIASGDISRIDYEKLGQLTESGKLSIVDAYAMIDSAVTAGIVDTKNGEYIKSKIAPTACMAEVGYPVIDYDSLQSDWLKKFFLNLNQRIISKSGNWAAWFFMASTGAFCLRFFNANDGTVENKGYSTASERMAALKAIAIAADTPTNNPPEGTEKPENDTPEPASDGENQAVGSDPITHSAVSSEEPGSLSAVSMAAHNLFVGDVVMSSWGYDQTNIDYYQITKLIGKRTVEIRKIACHNTETGNMTGDRAPIHGDFIGEAMRRTVDKQNNVNVLKQKFGRAWKIEPVAIVHGVRCYKAHSYSTYA